MNRDNGSVLGNFGRNVLLCSKTAKVCVLTLCHFGVNFRTKKRGSCSKNEKNYDIPQENELRRTAN